MRCFVTGATGFIGSAVARQLQAKGHDVIGLTSSASKVDALARAGVEPVLGNMRQPAEWVGAAEGADAVVHTAVLPTPRRPGDRWLTALTDAQVGTVRHLLEAAGGCRAFIITSGMTVYGPGAEPRTEASETAPFRIARAYAEGERLVLDAARRTGLPGMALRPGGVYGNGGIFGRFWAGPILDGKRAGYPGDGTQVLSFVHVEDCARAYVRAVEDPAPGEIFNVADDEPVAIGTLIRALARTAGAPKPFGIPAILFRLLAGPVVGEMLLSDVVISNRKMVEELGVELRYPTYREGVPAVVREHQPA